MRNEELLFAFEDSFDLGFSRFHHVRIADASHSHNLGGSSAAGCSGWPTLGSAHAPREATRRPVHVERVRLVVRGKTGRPQEHRSDSERKAHGFVLTPRSSLRKARLLLHLLDAFREHVRRDERSRVVVERR
jgi:hypothetical protein